MALLTSSMSDLAVVALGSLRPVVASVSGVLSSSGAS
jgi:hypothetical protein